MTRCDKCHENEANVFLTQIIDGTMTKMALCQTCGEELTAGAISPHRLTEYLQTRSPDDTFEQVAGNHAQYSREAFRFVRDGVQHAVQSHPGHSRHVTAHELLEALRSLATERYGTDARETLARWGITRCEDFGEIVFTLIDQGLFGRRAEDRKEDFEHGYDFATAFPT
jgi:uncharacterized repeat protein (TIGR04138 family)